MTVSQNGWPASSDRAAIGVVNPSVAGVTFPGGVKGGDVETVLMYVADRFNREVEPLHDGWCWGHAFRPIVGSTVYSNHASATAIDCNAPAHPQHKRGTFSASQVTKIRAIVGACDGVVRWGGDFNGTSVDEMHFEIVGNPTAVAHVAAKLRAASAPKPAPTDLPHYTNGSRVLKLTSPMTRGTDVATLQRFIGDLDVDGVYGPKTQARVRWYQSMRGLAVDGIAGPKTWAPILAAIGH